MAKYNSSYQGDEKQTARAVGRLLPISFKASREVSQFIRGKLLSKAIADLNAVIKGKRAVPFTRYNKDMPHRKGRGLAAGRYPKKASKYIRNTLNTLRANAEDQGMVAEKLEIIHSLAQRGPNVQHYGRNPGKGQKLRKATHIEIVAREAKPKPKKQVTTTHTGEQNSRIRAQVLDKKTKAKNVRSDGANKIQVEHSKAEQSSLNSTEHSRSKSSANASSGDSQGDSPQ